VNLAAIYMGVAAFLLLTLAAGILRILWGPTAEDRMMAAQLLGTTTGAVLVLLAQAVNSPALRDVALVFALLAAVTALAFVRLAWHSNNREGNVDE
jgi:multicomponent Na+:H+ antiporter subunit F